MTEKNQEASRAQGSGGRWADVLLLGACFGLLAGLVEGAGLLALQHLGWLNWNMAQMSVAREILYISPLFDLAIFLLLGCLFALAARVWLGRGAKRAAFFLFSFLMFFDWLGLSGRIRLSATLILSLGLATALKRTYRGREAGFGRTAERLWPVLLGITLLLTAGIEAGKAYTERHAVAALPPAAAGAPNVLILVMDTVRADHLSSLGYARATSPNLDRLARRGVLFENAISTSSWTLPAHASLLTGRSPHQHGAQSGPYDGRFPTLAEEFERRGYRTGAFSANYFFFSRQMGFGRGFVHFEDVFGSLADCFARTFYGRKLDQFVLQRMGFEDIPGRKTAEDVNRALLAWLDQRGEKPFFAFVNYFDAHDPYLPPQPFRGKFSAGKNPGGALNSFVLRHDLRRPEQLQGEIDAYDGALAYVDEQIGRLVAALGKRGLEGNTLLVIVSDHGESFGEHGLLLHRNALYRETIRVPLLIVWPGHVPAGVRISRPASIAAIPATILDLLGRPAPEQFPSPSLARLWNSSPETASGWPDALAELAQFRFELVKKNPAYSGSMASLVSPQWQFIEHEKLGTELYDWEGDAREEHNLVGTEKGARAANEMREALRARRASPRDGKPRRAQPR